MTPAQDLVPFSLFHGTSSHYSSAFEPGDTPTPWLHKDVALSLLKGAWDELSRLRHEIPDDVRENLCWDVTYEEIPWFVKNVMDQVSSYSNWQHGELYLTPSKLTAVNYACGGARYGGELLTLCKTAIDALSRLDDKKANELSQSAESLAEFLRGTEQPPIIVQFDALRIADLSTESSARDVREEIAFLTEGPMQEVLGSEVRILETLGQQTNFRLTSGCGIVKRILEVHVEDIDHYQPLDPFDLSEIPRSNLTD